MSAANGPTTEDSSVSKSSDEKNFPNMNVSVERLSDVERKLDVEVPWDEVKGRLDEAYDELKRGVAIKGFRKGKVPRRMLEQLFGKHVVKEVAQRLVQETMPQALQKEEITPVSEPHVEDQGISTGESFRYAASLQVVPEVEPKDYFGVDVKVRPTQVTDEGVQLALERKQREMTDYRSIEGRETQAGDVLLVDVMGKAGDRPIDMEQKVVELGEPPREPLPGIAAALTGVPADKDEVEVELELPVGDEQAEQEGEGPRTETARLLVTINEVREKIVPPLDDDFAKDTGEAETLEELKEVLRKKLEAEDEEQARNEAKDQLVGELLKRNDVPVVPALVERHLDRQLSLQKAILGMQGGSLEGIDDEALKENLRADATEAVQRALLLNAIGKKEQVEVQDADVEKRLSEIAAARGQNLGRVRSEYEKEGMMGSLRERIQEDKTLDLLMSKANIIREETSPETERSAAAEAPEEGGGESQSGPETSTDEQATEGEAE
jgi:trigger factor